MINPNKICFITCVNDDRMYEESLLYLQNLVVPEHIEVEFAAIRGARSITAAYNQAMRQSNAKYKIYLHQDVLVIEPNFIVDVIALFQRNENIGIMGVVGTNEVDFYGIWWQCKELLGAIYDNNTEVMLPYSYKNTAKSWMKAKNVDGLIIATQQDLLWQEKEFDGWHFYDMSQCMEFRNAGYEVAVISQERPWCIHICGKKNVDRDNGYKINRVKYLSKYKEYLYPLVSILIPTYNRPEYFKIALESAIKQTYIHLEIIICDNSTNERTANLMQSYQQDPRIRYFRNRTAKTKAENFQSFEQLVRGEYIQWLMDDDVLLPQKLEKMIKCFWDNPNVNLVTSCRRWINVQGNEIVNPAKLNFAEPEEYTVIRGEALGKKILLTMNNMIGEPSSFLFKKASLAHHYWQADCRGYKTISDVVMGLELLETGDCAYFQESLSCYRSHSGQEGRQSDTVILSRLEWVQLLEEYYAKQCFICDEAEYRQSLTKWLIDASEILKCRVAAQTQENELFIRYKQKIVEYCSVID